MITLTTLTDEMVDGQGRAAGRKLRRIVAICLDNFNVVLAEGSSPTKLTGKRFFGKLTHLGNGVKEYGLDAEHARTQMIDFFTRFSGEQVGDLSWAELDEKFHIAERRKDSSAILVLYDKLKKGGWEDDGAASKEEKAEASETV